MQEPKSLKTRINKRKTRISAGFSFGGDGEIRTLEPLLTVTRFPIVRARPATRLLRTVRYKSDTFRPDDLCIISHRFDFVNSFFEKYLAEAKIHI